MTKGQFIALTAVLGLATMAGAGYLAFAASDGGGGHGTGGPSSSAAAQGGSGGVIEVPTDGASASTGGAAQSATPSASATGGAGAGSGKVPACGDADIQVSTTDSQGAAGHISMVLMFVNTGAQVCRLQGYPGAALLGQNGADLRDAKRTLSGYSGGAEGLSSPPAVVLKPNATASAVLEWSDVPTGSGANGGCAVQNPLSLAVTPPNTTQSTTMALPAQLDVCAEFQVHPVLPGVVHTP